MSDGLSCPGDQIIRHSQVEPVSCREVRMSGERHHVILARYLAEPVCDRCLADFEECTLMFRYRSVLVYSAKSVLMRPESMTQFFDGASFRAEFSVA